MLIRKTGSLIQKPGTLAGLSIFILLELCVSLPLRAQSNFLPMKDPVQFRNKLTGVTQSTNTLESRFIQEKRLEVISEKIISNGLFCYKKENKLRWEYTKPLSYLIIMNGEKVLIRDENKENRFDASSNKVFQEINSIMLGAIRGTILEDEKKFRIDYRENDQYDLVKMKPASQQLNSYIAEIRIFFNKKTSHVAKLEIEESSGDYTKIEFTDMKVNTPLPDEKFSVR